MSTEREVLNVIIAIISSYNDGINIEDLDGEYEMWAHEPIPYLKLGYYSLLHFVRSHPELKICKNAEGKSVFKLNPLKEIDNESESYNWRMDKKNEKNEKRFTPYRKTTRYTSSKNKEGSSSDGYSSKASYRTSSSYQSQNFKRPHIITDPNKTLDIVHEPILNGQQLIGDDFALQLAIKNIGSTIWRKKENSALGCGLCISGQTIRACTKRLKNVQSMSNKITIMLGSADVYEGRSLEQMKEDYLELLDVLNFDLNYSKSAITIGTIPPLGNLSFMTQFEQSSTLTCFNNWLRQLASDETDIIRGTKHSYKLIDFHKEFLNDYYGINYNLFQDNARYVSGTKSPYVLFNAKGRSKAVSLFFNRNQSEGYGYLRPCSWSSDPFRMFD